MDLKTLLTKSIVSWTGLILAYWSYWNLTDRIDAKGIYLSYLAIPILILFETTGQAVRLMCLGSGKLIPNVHRNLLASASIADFWRRYNVWVSDWFYQILFRPLRKRPLIASMIVFAFSGVWHELVINVPLFLVSHVNLFGSMFIYFFLQWLAIAIDRVFLKKRPSIRRVFLYFALVIPAPLILNESLLRIFGWWR